MNAPTEALIRQELLRSCPVLEEILTTGMTRISSGEQIPALGFSTIRNLILLRRLMEMERCERTLEIGLAHAGSALTIAAVHRNLGRSPEGQHVAIDPYQQGYLKGAGLLALERAGLAGFVRHVSALSQHALPDLQRNGDKFDLIYIDGSHSFDDVFVDFYFCDKLVKAQGYIIFDDCGDYRVRKVTNFVKRNYSGAYTEIRMEHVFDVQNKPRLLFARLAGKNQVRIFRRTSEYQREWDSPLKAF